ncbi:MAG: DUF721 domain-containing protein [bacterium]
MDEVLDEFIQDNGLHDRIDSIRLEEEWSDILNQPLSENLSYGDFDDGRLRLKASNPSWSQEASLKKEAIKKTINEYFDRVLVDEIHIQN